MNNQMNIEMNSSKKLLKSLDEILSEKEEIWNYYQVNRGDDSRSPIMIEIQVTKIKYEE
jgi:hypothetical protein